MLVSIPPNWKRALIVVPFQSFLDVLWYGTWYYFNDSGVYPREYWERFDPLFAFFAWIPMGLAVSMGEPQTLREAIAFGAWIGFLTFAIYAGVELTFDPVWRAAWWYSVVDTTWGISVSAVSCSFGYWSMEKCCGTQPGQGDADRDKLLDKA
ncbi:unnamed protein product [Symbiodinium necroappetens]|uniref:Uncharacterized protein n=1 Tax=Symbiodinium necroappetens TaxID=1628268 RepID=A0A812X7M6_9DINO|nr:unnamed protein product [Symbiodinium necroappetens]